MASRTAPALELDGRLVQTNRAIARALDELVPEPALFPADAEARGAVEEAERFGDEVLQHATRRILLWAYLTDPRSVTGHPLLGQIIPAWIPRVRWLPRPLLRDGLGYYGVTPEVAREDRRSLPGMLDRIDGFIAAGA